MAKKIEKAVKAPLRIVNLVAENFKRLVAVEITPDGNVVEITGANEAGKSSVVDAIWAALGGEDSIPDMPIRKGESKAMIRLDLGEYVVIRSFKLKDDGKTASSQLRVENADGFRSQSPQTVINGLLGRFAFDPLEFDRLKMKDKFETMKGFVPGVDFAAIAKSDDEDRKARTDVNRDAKAIQAQMDAIVIPDDAPTEKTDEAALVDEVASVGDFNAQLERREERRQAIAAEAQGHREDAKAARDRATDLRKQADALDAQAEASDTLAKEREDRLANAEPLPAPKDASEVRARLEKAKADNALVDLRNRRETLGKQHDSLVTKSAALTAAIDKRQSDKLAAISEAKLPVDGLEFGDGVILLNGIPLDQCSAAQRLKTSIAIAMAANPRLRVLRISEGSLLDSNGMKILAEMCKGRGYQAWVERVDDTGKTGFFIEEGRLRDAAAEREAA
jgi:hypothetical protein